MEGCIEADSRNLSATGNSHAKSHHKFNEDICVFLSI